MQCGYWNDNNLNNCSFFYKPLNAHTSLFKNKIWNPISIEVAIANLSLPLLERIGPFACTQLNHQKNDKNYYIGVPFVDISLNPKSKLEKNFFLEDVSAKNKIKKILPFVKILVLSSCGFVHFKQWLLWATYRLILISFWFT